ncbi:MAG: methylmalonyl Co-A mutase-associated GTPase MeaB [Phaeodactylibacter sp.]|uniref:methylmalonyl Co-A mutase-associated GTPase MeaB n=1 Tax=Phaeodactylibacter sp. TaxID=1940289 RepID=UPI0032EDC5A0
MPDDQSPTGRHKQKGIVSPGSLNPNLKRIRKKRWGLEDYTTGIQKGNRVALAKAITLIESTRQEHQALAQQIIEACLPQSGRSVRIGVTGTPGVGKSTFIEAFGQHILQEGRKLAVLAVDPTSQMTHGSILGDKTRMEQLSHKEHAFIRPSPAGESLGGVARKTREAIILCEAAGYDTVLIETVGVGQSETAVHSMTDFFLLLLLPGAGDELQGIKRGIVEMADLAVVNKADGERLPLARQAKQSYRNAMHLFPPKESEWATRVEICSATTGMGIPEIWKDILAYQEQTQANGYFGHNRQAQARYWLHETINQELRRLFFNHEAVREQLKDVEAAVMNGQQSSFQAAEALLRAFQGPL